MGGAKNSEAGLEPKIKKIFRENMSSISMDSSLREKLISLPETVKPASPVERFLEKEICVPAYSVSAAAGVIVVIAGFLASTLLLPGEIPQPGYRIMEMQACQVRPDQEEIN